MDEENERRTYRIKVDVVAKPGEMPHPSELIGGISEGLPQEWYDIDASGYAITGIRWAKEGEGDETKSFDLSQATLAAVRNHVLSQDVDLSDRVVLRRAVARGLAHEGVILAPHRWAIVVRDLTDAIFRTGSWEVLDEQDFSDSGRRQLVLLHRLRLSGTSHKIRMTIDLYDGEREWMSLAIAERWDGSMWLQVAELLGNNVVDVTAAERHLRKLVELTLGGDG